MVTPTLNSKKKLNIRNERELLFKNLYLCEVIRCALAMRFFKIDQQDNYNINFINNLNQTN